jgi:hypothetical protein
VSPTGSCEICGGYLRSNCKYGVCTRTPACKRESDCRRRDAYRKGTNSPREATKYLASYLAEVKSRAKKRGILFDLEQVPSVPLECPCCGRTLSMGGYRTGQWHSTATLDRVIPDKGYTVGNVQWLCSRCNVVKSNATPEELMMVAQFVSKIILDGHLSITYSSHIKD